MRYIIYKSRMRSEGVTNASFQKWAFDCVSPMFDYDGTSFQTFNEQEARTIFRRLESQGIWVVACPVEITKIKDGIVIVIRHKSPEMFFN